MAEIPRSVEIGSHLQRMSCYCALIARRLGLDAELIRIAARLHDVGMAAVNSATLGKPGPLTPLERRELEAHPELGHAMLAGSGVQLLDTAAEIALTHHERFDGAGYPRGLTGDEIPIAGRIAAVADAFDALTTDRIYRSAAASRTPSRRCAPSAGATSTRTSWTRSWPGSTRPSTFASASPRRRKSWP